MKICLVSEYFYPQSKGGTEKYVFELAKKLISEKNQVDILTAGPSEFAHYKYEELSVKAVHHTDNLALFKSILDNEEYDRIHFHTLTPTFNTSHIALARTKNAEIYFTAHIPAVTCIHGDLMQFGKIACDGLILKHRCTACYISKKKISKPISNLIAGLVSRLNYPKTTANVVEKKIAEVSALNILCDKIFIFTEWQKRIFIKNGFDQEKLVNVQQMDVNLPTNNTPYPVVPKNKGRIKIGFVGRVSYEKGLHTLLSAFLDPSLENLELHIAAIVPDEKDSYFQKLTNLVRGKSNIFWAFNLNPSSMEEFYQNVDLICIPSIWYETGPFVLYEAFKYNLPVIANNLGDMQVWQRKGYSITTYNNHKELSELLYNLCP